MTAVAANRRRSSVHVVWLIICLAALIYFIVHLAMIGSGPKTSAQDPNGYNIALSTCANDYALDNTDGMTRCMSNLGYTYQP